MQHKQQQIQRPRAARKKRYCKIEGCGRTVKSQGMCQRHGAKPRICKVVDCTKQAQGNFDGMCKSHFHAAGKANAAAGMQGRHQSTKRDPQSIVTVFGSVYDEIIPASAVWSPESPVPMPLFRHLRDGFASAQPCGWHRNQERVARGILPVRKLSTKFEAWECQLAFAELAMLTGRPNSSVALEYLAHAWGRGDGFHAELTNTVCTQRGHTQPRKCASRVIAPLDIAQPSSSSESDTTYDSGDAGADDGSLLGDWLDEIDEVQFADELCQLQDETFTGVTYKQHHSFSLDSVEPLPVTYGSLIAEPSVGPEVDVAYVNSGNSYHGCLPEAMPQYTTTRNRLHGLRLDQYQCAR